MTMSTIAPSNHSYLDSDLKLCDEYTYQNAGICIWRPKLNKTGIEILMGIEGHGKCLSFFGGKRDYNDTNSIDTAIREFNEETGKIFLNKNNKININLNIIKSSLNQNIQRKVFYDNNGQCVLYFYQFDFNCNIQKKFNDKTSNYRPKHTEMLSIHWISFDLIYKCFDKIQESILINSIEPKIQIGNTPYKYPLRKFVINILSEYKALNYLLSLHNKYTQSYNYLNNTNKITNYTPQSSHNTNNNQNINMTNNQNININNTIKNNNIGEQSHFFVTKLHPINLTKSIRKKVIGNICNFQNFDELFTKISDQYLDLNDNFEVWFGDSIINTEDGLNNLQGIIQYSNNEIELVVVPTLLMTDDQTDFEGGENKSDTDNINQPKNDNKSTLNTQNVNVISQILPATNDNNDQKDDIFNLMNQITNLELKNQFLNNQLNNKNQNQNHKNYKLRQDTWIWQWKNDFGKWENFDKNLSKQIEIACLGNESTISCIIKNIPYTINLIRRTQKNDVTSNKRDIRRHKIQFNNHSSKHTTNTHKSPSNHHKKQYSTNNHKPSNHHKNQHSTNNHKPSNYHPKQTQISSINKPNINSKKNNQLKWQWYDNKHNKKIWIDFDKNLSIKIENARLIKNWKIYHFKLNNKNYEINFKTMKQINQKTKYSRNIRLVPINAKSKIIEKWEGPINRKIFGKKIMKLYHITNNTAAQCIKKSNKMIRGNNGMFGGGIYFAESPSIANYKALHKGWLITCQVFIGKELLLKNAFGGKYSFRELQKKGYDSVYAPNGSGNGKPERVVYNYDQVYVLEVKKYP